MRLWKRDDIGDQMIGELETMKIEQHDTRRPIEKMADAITTTIGQLHGTRDRLETEIADRQQYLAETLRQIDAMQAAEKILMPSDDHANLA